MANIVTWQEYDGTMLRPDTTGTSGLIVDGQRYWRGGNRVVEHDLDEMNDAERLALLREQIRRHDFYYQMSDDHRVWCSGQASLGRIKQIAQTLPVEVARSEWRNQFGRYDVDGGVYYLPY